MTTGPAVWLQLVQQDMDSVNAVNAGSSTANPDGRSCINDEEELVLSLIPVSLSGEAYDFNGLYGPLDSISEETEHDINWKQTCRNSCGPDEDNKDSSNSLKILVELGCLCRGTMSKMCIKCLLKWFGPRIMLDKDMTCEVCQTLLNESVRKTVLSSLADHTGGRDILVEALGPRLVRTHEARTPSRDYAHNSDYQGDDAGVQEVVSFAPRGAVDAAHVAVVTPDAASDTPGSNTPASSSPASNQHQQRSRSVLIKIRPYMCCTATQAPTL